MARRAEDSTKRFPTVYVLFMFYVIYQSQMFEPCKFECVYVDTCSWFYLFVLGRSVCLTKLLRGAGLLISLNFALG